MARWFENKFEVKNSKRRRNRIFPKSNLSYTSIIIGINILTFLGFFVLTSIIGETKAISLIALQPAIIISATAIWTLITSMFMHAGLPHLFVNMFSLLFIGNFVEKLIGKKRFLRLYFTSGIFAGIFFVIVTYLTGSDLNVYAVGASGAIFGLGGLLAVLTPRLPVLVFFIIPMPMWIAMGFLLAVLWILSLGLGLPIGNIAHLGGLIVGVGYGFYLQKKYPKRTKIIKNYFSR
jgi:membrane associated rhomboid family serine protease